MSRGLQAASALARGPNAAAEAAAEAAARLGVPPDVLVLFTTLTSDPAHAMAAARAEAPSARVIGCCGAGVVAGGLEIEDGPAAAVMALANGVHAPVLATTFEEIRPPEGQGLALVLTDAGSVAATQVVWPGWRTIGALATGVAGAYPAYRWLDEEVASNGLVALFIEGAPQVGVAQGCRPIGPEHTVTRADGLVLAEVDGRPAFEVFAARARPLLDDLPRAAQTIFLLANGAVYGLMQFDPERGLLALSSPMPTGCRFRFAVRDAWAARDELRRVARDLERRLEGRRPRAGFYFACAGRGQALFGVEDHDVSIVRSVLGDFPLVGLFAGGELADGRSHLFSGVLAVLP